MPLDKHVRFSDARQVTILIVTKDRPRVIGQRAHCVRTQGNSVGIGSASNRRVEIALFGRDRFFRGRLLSLWGVKFFGGDVLVPDAFESVQGGDLVGLGEGGVVEDGVGEVGN